MMEVERGRREQGDQNIYFRFPFISQKVNKIVEDAIKQMTKRLLRNITIRMVFFNNRKIGSYINHKEQLANKMCSMIVYKFVCPKCNMEYVGSSTRLLYTRFFEHKGISHRTLLPLGKPQFSSIRSHCENNCETLFDISDFKILCKGRYETELRLLETFYIEKIKPALNVDNSCSSMKLF